MYVCMYACIYKQAYRFFFSCKHLVCMYACMHVYTNKHTAFPSHVSTLYACVYVCMHVYTHKHTSFPSLVSTLQTSRELSSSAMVLIYVCMYVCMYVSSYGPGVCMYTCMHVCMHVCMWVNTLPVYTGIRVHVWFMYIHLKETFRLSAWSRYTRYTHVSASIIPL